MKNVINWNYERASWQWDVLCLVIVAFIFLTPKAWFEQERNRLQPKLPLSSRQSYEDSRR